MQLWMNDLQSGTVVDIMIQTSTILQRQSVSHTRSVIIIIIIIIIRKDKFILP